MPPKRRLPHIYPENRWLFLTWHLNSDTFAWADAYLDGTRTRSVSLHSEAIATLIVESLFRGESLGHYQLGPWVIMANHVHVLLLPLISPSLSLKSLKGATAREANRVLDRTGEHFWQRESYDHWVRDEKEWDRIANYIEENPVKAGLVERVQDYPWSSANDRWQKSAARKSACATIEPSACATGDR